MDSIFATTQITVQDLSSQLEANTPLQIIDIRRSGDFDEWHIAEAHSLDVYDSIHRGLPGALESFSSPESQPIIVVCYVGQTSQIAANYLRSRGLAAHSLIGGMAAWSTAWNMAELATETGTIFQFRRTGKGCLSYVIQQDDECLIVDPSLDTEVYLEFLKNRSLKPAGVIDTHIHADHVSRGPEIAGQLNIGYYLPSNQRVEFPFQALQPGSEFIAGIFRLVIVPLPGHTAESIGLIWKDTAFFSGDALFLDGFGRPDLADDDTQAQQNQIDLHKTLLGFQELNPELLVFPSHTHQPVPFSESILTKQLGKLISTLDIPHEFSAFHDRYLKMLPPTPPNHRMIVKANLTGQLPTPNLTMLEAGPNRCAIGT